MANIFGKISMETLTNLRSGNVLAGATVEGELMRRAFDLVANPKDWKAPVDKVLYPAVLDYEIAVIAFAVKYMTATEATVTELPDGKVRITAPGYRNGPAA